MTVLCGVSESIHSFDIIVVFQSCVSGGGRYTVCKKEMSCLVDVQKFNNVLYSNMPASNS